MVSVGRGWSSYSAEFGDNEIDSIMFKISRLKRETKQAALLERWQLLKNYKDQT